MLVVFGAVVVGTLCSPLRQISSDTVPGRLGAAVLRCGGGFDLRTVDWIAERADAGRLPYWARPSGDRIVSVFGPGPAVAGALALPDLAGAPGLAAHGELDDAMLRRRERITAAVLLGVAAALLVLASSARRGPLVSAGTGLLAAASFAGAATLGQGLWQQTVALPPLIAALAALAWRHRAPRCAIGVPALLALAVLLRPTMAPVAAGLGVAWCLGERRASTSAHGPDGFSLRRAAGALGLAAIAVAPLLAWNLVELGHLVPTQQLEANARVTEHIFVLTRAQLGYGLGGLLLSPGRGWLWFAPIALVGGVVAARAGDRLARCLAAGIAAQLLVVAVFHMWWGGICFGPRFLGEATWVGIWLALGHGGLPGRIPRALLGAAIAVTIIVGQLGLWGWRAEQWETRRNPDIDQNALWDFADSPVIAILTADITDQLLALDAPDAPLRMRCEHGRLRRAP